MPAMLILAVAVMGLVLVVLAVVVVGIRQEPSPQELTRRRNTCKILPLTVGKFHPALSGHRSRWDNDVSTTVRTARR